MTDSQRQPSHPPSEPRPARRSFVEPARDAPVRLQLLGALLLPFLLIAGLLYVWRRPRADESAKVDAGANPPASAEATATVDAGAPAAPAGPAVKLGEVKILGCQDARKKLPPEQCDHVPLVEQALVKAIESQSKCLPESAGAGSIEYAVDVTFTRKRTPVVLSLPRAGRSFKNAKVVGPCAKAVRAQLATLSLEGAPHTHARYKLSVVATYGAAGRER